MTKEEFLSDINNIFTNQIKFHEHEIQHRKNQLAMAQSSLTKIQTRKKQTIERMTKFYEDTQKGKSK